MDVLVAERALESWSYPEEPGKSFPLSFVSSSVVISIATVLTIALVNGVSTLRSRLYVSDIGWPMRRLLRISLNCS